MTLMDIKEKCLIIISKFRFRKRTYIMPSINNFIIIQRQLVLWIFFKTMSKSKSVGIVSEYERHYSRIITLQQGVS